MNNKTALQITDFNFYGDSLIALKDNATGEIYTSINHILRAIGFTERQIRHNRNKWINDTTVSKGAKILSYLQKVAYKILFAYLTVNSL